MSRIALILALLLAAGHAEAGSRDPLRIRALGEGFYWSFSYAGPDGKLDTADDIAAGHDLLVPRGAPVRVEITSADYVYAFRVPELELKQVAVPGLRFELEFLLERTGSHELEVDPLCGVNFLHDNDAMGRLRVVPVAEFERWLRSH